MYVHLNVNSQQNIWYKAITRVKYIHFKNFWLIWCSWHAQKSKFFFNTF